MIAPIKPIISLQLSHGKPHICPYGSHIYGAAMVRLRHFGHQSHRENGGTLGMVSLGV